MPAYRIQCYQPGCGKTAIYVDACNGYGSDETCGWGRQYANGFERDAAEHEKAERKRAEAERAQHRQRHLGVGHAHVDAAGVPVLQVEALGVQHAGDDRG